MYLTTFSPNCAHSPPTLDLSTNKCSVTRFHTLTEHVLLSGNRQQKEQYIWVLYQITEMICGKSMRTFFLDVNLHWFIDCLGYGLWEGLLGLVFYLGVEHNLIKASVMPSAFCYQAQTMLLWQWKRGRFMFVWMHSILCAETQGFSLLCSLGSSLTEALHI